VTPWVRIPALLVDAGISSPRLVDRRGGLPVDLGPVWSTLSPCSSRHLIRSVWDTPRSRSPQVTLRGHATSRSGTGIIVIDGSLGAPDRFR